MFAALQARGEDRPVVACACMLSPYSSHDPAPPDPRTDGLTDGEVGAVLRDAARPLFERYGAMFSLRNRGGAVAVAELGRVRNGHSTILPRISRIHAPHPSMEWIVVVFSPPSRAAPPLPACFFLALLLLSLLPPPGC